MKELVDPRLGDNYKPTELHRAMLTASLCISHLSTMRPSMMKVNIDTSMLSDISQTEIHADYPFFFFQVVDMLKNGEQGLLQYHPKSSGEKAMIIDNCDSQAYNRTSYQNDLNRHLQLVME